MNTRVTLALCLWLGLMAVGRAAPYEPPGAGPRPGVASDAHRGDARGAYGGLKSRRPPLRGAGDVRDSDKKQPYYYRYYSDTDRSPRLLPPLRQPRHYHQEQELVGALPRLPAVAASAPHCPFLCVWDLGRVPLRSLHVVNAFRTPPRFAAVQRRQPRWPKP
ncbi:MAG: hypothetical protein WDN31_09360 [Hyphomicrobium sp.]